MRDIFLTNHSDQLFLDRLIESFKNCNEFKLTVSFIKKPGLDLIINSIEDALKRGVKGKIITSTYQNFTDTPSLTTFLILTKKYPNFECHLDDYCFGHDGFHSKGYMFYYDDRYEIYVGSTNITYFALKYNIERNVSLTSSVKSSSFIDAEKAFDELWEKTIPFNEEKICEYERRLKITINRRDMDFFDTSQETTFKLNPMQQKALTQLMSFRASGAKKALVVAATGSGKTYLSVFDARNFQAQKLLFVVHNETILSEAMKTFQGVFKESRTYGFFTGKSKDKEADFIFATNVTMAKHLTTFPKDYFDYIVIDECHHASASTYKSIINYFQPGFLLGLTATPERTDDEDIFDLFDENLPFVLSLRDAIVNKLIVPFHYYGIRVKSIDYNEENFKKDFLKQNNIDFCIKEIVKHAPTTKLKCIAFCKNNEHAKKVSRLFNESGYSSIVLNASSSQAERIIYLSKLENELDPLKIICAVDVLNEGVDIPSINMVLFLRPTDSSIIFLQQLGRGLRKSDGKEYLTVLDFIGNNYKRSTQIALGLASLGRTTYLEKEYVKQLISTNFSDLGLPDVKISLDRNQWMKY